MNFAPGWQGVALVGRGLAVSPIVATFVGSIAQEGTLGTITWPGGTAVGDTAIFMPFGFNSVGFSAGYTPFFVQQSTDSGIVALWSAYWKVLTAGDISGPPQFSNNSSGGCIGIVMRNAPYISLIVAAHDVINDFVAGFTKSANCMGIVSMVSLRSPSPLNITASFTERVEADMATFDGCIATSTPAAYTNNATISFSNVDSTYHHGIAVLELLSVDPGATLPANTVAPAVTGTLRVGQTLTCTQGTWTGTPTPTYAYQWYQSPSTAIGGATASTYVLQAAEAGLNVFCRVTATNTAGAVSTDSNTVGPVTALPVNTVAPAVTGTAQQGQTLTSTQGTWTGTPTPTYAYQWYQSPSTAISGATASTYVLVAGDVGLTVFCRVTATNTEGSTSADSNTTATIIPLAPVISVAPVVSGALTSGSVLSCTTGTWTNSPSSYTYQWVRLPSTNVGTNSSTYTTVAGDETFNIKCQVTATNAGGSSSPADSNTVGPITAAGPWIPADLAGLIGWWKADTGVTHSSGAVSQWNDQSGNNYHLTQATGTAQPTYSTTSFNGNHGITFDGTDFLQNTSFAQGGTDKLSFFIVARKISVISSNDSWASYSVSANDYDNVPSARILYYPTAFNVIAPFRNGGILTGQAITTGTNYRIGTIWDGTNQNLYLNNVAASPSTSSGNFGSSGKLLIAAAQVSGNASDFANMCVAEVVFTNTAISSTDRDELDNYFKTKWGL